jgi:phytoene dehydrogenase-like protein
MKQFDLIVIGGGIAGGLPCAAYLQKAGLDVLVLEANAEVAAFCATHETWPETLDSPHAAINFCGNSPSIEDLDLEHYGFRYRTSPVALATSHRDGTNCLICHDPELTARNFALHSQRDAERMFEIQRRVEETLVEMNEIAFFSPHPDAAKFERTLELCSYAMGIPLDDLSTMTGPEAIELTFESDRVRQTLVCPLALHEHGAPLARGQGAFGVALSLYYTTGLSLGGNEGMVDAVVRCFLEHGGTLYTRCPVERIELQSGRATAVILGPDAAFPGERIEARYGIVSNVGAPKTLDLVGEDVMRTVDSRLASKMKHWKMDMRGSTVTSWLIKGEVPWGSVAFDPLIRQAALIYRAFDTWQGAKKYLVDMLNNETWASFGQVIEILDYGACDPSAVSPEGFRVIRGEEVLPYPLRGLGGAEGWDSPLRDEMLLKRHDTMEAIAPGFKKQTVESYQWTPIDIWRTNRAAIFGQVLGGDFTEDQWMLDRMPYRMPITGLYMSNAVWPAGLSWMASGYNAAQVVAEDCAVRRQPWWVGRPTGWFTKNFHRLVVPILDEVAAATAASQRRA